MPHTPVSPVTKAGSDDNSDEAAQRKKKNADAQAAFRARRANYIATLEAAGISSRPLLASYCDGLFSFPSYLAFALVLYSHEPRERRGNPPRVMSGGQERSHRPARREFTSPQ